MKPPRKMTITLRVQDIETVIGRHAFNAVKYGALVDYCGRKVVQSSSIRNLHGWGAGLRKRSYDEQRKLWNEVFLDAKAALADFGLTVEPLTEEQTLRVVPSHKAQTGGLGRKMTEVIIPTQTHLHAKLDETCKAAAQRAVETWRQRETT